MCLLLVESRQANRKCACYLLQENTINKHFPELFGLYWFRSFVELRLSTVAKKKTKKDNGLVLCT